MTTGAARVSPIRSAVVLVSLAVVSASLTVVYLGMRAVMDIGGVCAEGAVPFEISRPCPEGVPGLLMGGFWLGAIAAIVYIGAAARSRVPSLAGLLWPALFVSLGFNFLEYAINPPEGDGIVWGWMIPGILFMLMGVVPLLIWLGFIRDRIRDKRIGEVSALGSMAMSPRFRVIRRSPPPPPPPPSESHDLVAELERLDTLHRSGALTGAEYQKAKRRLLS